MRNKIIILIIIGLIVFLYRSKPSFDDHINRISSDLLENSDITEEPNEEIREGLNYKDYYICSATQNKSKGTMVTVGIMKKIKVVNKDWVKDFIKKLKL